MGNRPRSVRSGAVFSLVVLAALLFAVYRLPPDTTWATVESLGVLRACVPETSPPLVTGDPAMPGADVEILREVASSLGLRLQLTRNPAIGRDFNPRNWRLTRAQCLVIAGGVVDTPATRSFIDVIGGHLETGWALVAVDRPAGLAGSTIGFHAGTSGLDRLALSRYLRSVGATVRLVTSAAALQSGLESGEFDLAVADALTARVLVAELGAGAEAMWLPAPLERHAIGLGVWKGDLTLKRRLEAELAALRHDGTMAEILARYDLAPITEECWACEGAEAQ